MPDIDQIFSRAALIEVWRSGARPKFILFWGHRGPTDDVGSYVLSQWRDAPFIIDDIRYPTAEHYMMAEKARLFQDEDLCQQIIASDDPGKAKALGRKIENFNETEWTRHRFDIVTTASLAKFSQDKKLLDYLLATTGKVLVEASPRDYIWGAGIARDDPAIADPERWRGDNLLGFALMKARARLLMA